MGCAGGRLLHPALAETLPMLTLARTGMGTAIAAALPLLRLLDHLHCLPHHCCLLLRVVTMVAGMLQCPWMQHELPKMDVDRVRCLDER